MEQTIQEPTKKQNTKRKVIETVLSIRKRPTFFLPGDDPKRGKVKIGSALAPNSKFPLRGLSFEEEKIFLPELTGISPRDTAWRNTTETYWSDISVPIPDDGEGVVNGFSGKILRFTFEIAGDRNIEKYNKASLEDKAKLLEKWVFPNSNGDVVATLLEGTEDYVLFRYCLVYSKVANNVNMINKSAKILFYLYSKEEENREKKDSFDKSMEAMKIFIDIMPNETKVDGVLRMYGTYPNDETMFSSIADKHMYIKERITENPAKFILFGTDNNLEIKSNIKEAIENNIIHNPTNTDTYYYGDNNEVLLGNNIDDAILFLKSTETEKIKVRDAISAQLKNKRI